MNGKGQAQWNGLGLEVRTQAVNLRRGSCIARLSQADVIAGRAYNFQTVLSISLLPGLQQAYYTALHTPVLVQLYGTYRGVVLNA